MFHYLNPTPITAASGFVSSTIAEPEAAWSNETSYAVDDPCFVLVDGIHQRFVSKTGPNLNHDPLTDDGTNWEATGPTNRWGMFDAKVQSQSTALNEITVVLEPTGRVDTLALLNIAGVEARVVMHSEDGELIWDKTYSLVSSSGITTLPQYFYTPIVRKQELVIRGLPRFANPTVTVTISAPGETVGVGCLLLGFARKVGGVKFGASVGITDYSNKEADDFGNQEPVERGFSKRGNFDVQVPTAMTSELLLLLAGLRAKKVLYIGTRKHSATAIYGFYRDFTEILRDDVFTILSIEIEGII